MFCIAWAPFYFPSSQLGRLGLDLFRNIIGLGGLDGQWALLDHQGHDLVEHVGGGHGGEFGVGVVGRGDLDDVGGDEVDPLEAPDDGAELARGPTPRLGGPRGGGEGRVERVDVDGQVDRVLGAHPLLDAVDDAVDADGVDLSGLDAGEAAVAVVLVVGGPREGGADAGVDAAVVGQQALLRGPVEVGAVVDGGLLAGGAAEDLGLPRVEVGVEVDDRDGPVGLVDAAQEGEGDGVVAAQRDDARERLARLADARLVGGGVGRAGQEHVVPVLDLLEGVVVVVAAMGVRFWCCCLLLLIFSETNPENKRREDGKKALTKSLGCHHNPKLCPRS